MSVLTILNLSGRARETRAKESFVSRFASLVFSEWSLNLWPRVRLASIVRSLAGPSSRYWYVAYVASLLGVRCGAGSCVFQGNPDAWRLAMARAKFLVLGAKS